MNVSTASASILISFMVVWLYLLHRKRIGEVAFVTLTTITAVSALAVYLGDRLIKFDLKNAEIILTDARSIQKDISSEAKEIYEAIAKTNVQSALERRAFIGEAEIAEIIDKRDRAISMYKKANIDPSQYYENIEQINLRIAQILAYKITAGGWAKKYEQKYAGKPDEWRMFTETFNNKVKTASDAKELYRAVEKILREEGFEKLGESDLREIRNFSNTGSVSGQLSEGLEEN